MYENVTDSELEDEEMLEILIPNYAHNIRKEYTYFERKNISDIYTDEQFRRRYRLTRECFNQLLQEIHHRLDNRHTQYTVSPRDQLLLTLRSYASYTFQNVYADLLGIHRTTANRIIWKVTQAIASLRPRYIYMPRSLEEKAQVIQDFQRVGAAGFPGVIGCIDGTHIPIINPSRRNGELYRNRKGWFSINAMMVCDANMRFRYVVARWPGSCHDSTIFQHSQLAAELQMHRYPGYLLGDSGYACTENLLTPVLIPTTRSERNYNRAHITTRNVIERSFGVLKKRFRVLEQRQRTKINRTLSTIVACCVLHNLCNEHGDIDPPPMDDEELPVPPVQPNVEPHARAGDRNVFRNHIIRTHF